MRSERANRQTSSVLLKSDPDSPTLILPRLQSLTAGRSNRRHRLIGRPDIDNDEVGALKRTAQGNGLTDAAGSPSDDDRAVCEQVVCTVGDLPGGGVQVAAVVGLCGQPTGI